MAEPAPLYSPCRPARGFDIQLKRNNVPTPRRETRLNRSSSDPGQAALFEGAGSPPPSLLEAPDDAPLATRMRPRTLDEFLGQEHLVGPGRALRRAIEEDRLHSMVLWGPPGSGKTTLAAVISRQTDAHMIALSGVAAGVADLRAAAEEARRRRRGAAAGGVAGRREATPGTGPSGFEHAGAGGRGGEISPPLQRTILFIDEIHRFNKSQQDAVLPHVESGLLTLIGATTENPSFEVNNALLSRARVYRLRPLTDEEVGALVDRALIDDERGLGMFHVKLFDDARGHLVSVAGGDARVALNTLELAALATDPNPNGERVVTLAAVEDALQRRQLHHDRAGDLHYDLISALIKSVRGSDPDAAVYWLARILEAGEDPLFVARRLVILASEDVGLADPAALEVAVAAQQAAHFVGMPEAHFALAEATLYLASAPKSNSAKTAYDAARAAIERAGELPVPLHLRNPVTGLMRAEGYGKGYRYPHAYQGHVVDQDHLPQLLAGEHFYQPSDQGHEAEIALRLAETREQTRAASETAPEPAAEPPEPE